MARRPPARAIEDYADEIVLVDGPLFFDSTGDATRGHVVGSTTGDPMSEAGPHPLLHERFGGLWAASTA